MTWNSLAADETRATLSSSHLAKIAPIDPTSSTAPMGTRRSRGRGFNVTRSHPHRQRWWTTRSKIRSRVERQFRRPKFARTMTVDRHPSGCRTGDHHVYDRCEVAIVYLQSVDWDA